MSSWLSRTFIKTILVLGRNESLHEFCSGRKADHILYPQRSKNRSKGRLKTITAVSLKSENTLLSHGFNRKLLQEHFFPIPDVSFFPEGAKSAWHSQPLSAPRKIIALLDSPTSFLFLGVSCLQAAVILCPPSTTHSIPVTRG